jgi:hypothetical protein
MASFFSSLKVERIDRRVYSRSKLNWLSVEAGRLSGERAAGTITPRRSRLPIYRRYDGQSLLCFGTKAASR